MIEFFNRLLHDPATVRKFIVAAVTALGILLANGMFDGTVKTWVITILAVANALGVYGFRNKPDTVVDIRSRLAAYGGEKGAIGLIELLIVILVIVIILAVTGVI